MDLFRKNKNIDRVSPLTPADSPAAERVLRTYELLELDYSQMMLVGSAALTLYGVELLPFDPIDGENTFAPRPSDLDFATRATYMQQLYDPAKPDTAQTTPNGLAMRAKIMTAGRRGLHITTPELPVDLLSNFRDGRDNLARYDAEFRRYLAANSRPVEGTTMRIITPEAMHTELLKRQRTGMDPKAATDLADLRRARLK